MKRKLALLLLTFLTLTSFKSWGQETETLTVFSGNDSHFRIPINAEYFDEVGTFSQFIIPASEIGPVLGGYISQLQFHISNLGINSDNIKYVVVKCSLKEVNYETFSEPVTTGLTTVYEGCLDYNGTAMTFSFSIENPYHYSGGHLLVCIEVVSTNIYWYTNDLTFVGSKTNYPSSYSNKGEETTFNFLPSTTIVYTGGTSCLAPTGFLVTDITASSATISWDDNGAESYDLAYGEAVTFDMNDASTYTLLENLTSSSVQLSDLTADAEYKYAVKSHCDGDAASAWSRIYSFTPSATPLLTVYDGNQRTIFVPINTNFGDCLNSAAQFVVPAEQLTPMVNREILSMKFYLDKNNIHNLENLGGPTYTGYIEEVGETTLSEFIGFVPEAKFFNGHVSLSNDNAEMLIEFSAPFAYHGGNLAIAFECTESAQAASIFYYGTSVYNGSIYRNGLTGATSNSFIPKTTFCYRPLSSYTINIHVNGNATEQTFDNGQMLPTIEPENIPAGLVFCGWSDSDISTYTFEAPIYAIRAKAKYTDLYAVFRYDENTSAITRGGRWVEVTQPSQLKDGEQVIIVFKGLQTPLVMCDRQKNYHDFEHGTISCGYDSYLEKDVVTSSLPEDVVTLTAIENSGSWKFSYDDKWSGNSTLASSGEGLAPKEGDWWCDTWTIEQNGQSVAIKDTQYDSHIIFISSFRCTSSISGHRAQLFRYSPTINYYMTEVVTGGEVGNVSTKNIIIRDGRNLTVTGRLELAEGGLFRNKNVADFVFADGAQFFYKGSEPISATFQKNITGYTGENDNYYLIANPTNNTTVTELATNEFDLYTFNPAGDGEGNEWINQGTNPVLENGIGYLYANSDSTTLKFVGQVLPASTVDVHLVRVPASPELGFPGFNLIGNPFACNAKIYGYNFYQLRDGEFIVNESIYEGTTIAPCEGVFVEAESNGQIVRFHTEESGPNPEPEPSALNLTLSQNRGEVIDRAIVSFDGRSDLHKFMLNPNRTNIRLAKNGEEYAVLSADAEGEIPVSFKAEKNGSYTINVNTDNVEAQYLHLIDNMTGMDTDLLSTPSYTFNASTSDYAYRFKLVLSVNGVEEGQNDADNFAFMSDGNLVIDNIEGEATLQIVDVLGRVLSTETVSGSYNKPLNLKAGLYILNLNGMTQKIVVR